jgi:quinol monooxygenase YgiN
VAWAMTARWVIREGEEAAVLDALRQLAEPTRAEPGVLQWQPHRDPENPRVVFLYEQYTDPEAYEAHVASEHFERWGKGEALPRLEDRERTFYETVDL